ncbi:MAG: Fic family protein [Gammaproteobacteria bacterium]
MVTPTLIAAALARVRSIADTRHSQIVASSEIQRADRELLVATGWLQEIIRGWYMLVRPDVATGDTTAWYANFWDFVLVYLDHRFGTDYCLSAESSLDLHMDSPVIQKQVIVIVKQGAGLRTLMHDTSLMIYADVKNFPTEITKKRGLNVMSLPYALCKVAPSYFINNPREAELALRSIKIPSEISRIIIRNNLKTAASRLIGAYQFLKDEQMAETIKNDLATVGMLVKAQNPFQQTAPLLSTRLKSPYSGRIHAMWNQAREIVIKNFPLPPGLPEKPEEYLHRIDEVYQYDAYNSLSIEGYQVTYELIERVKNNLWDPANNTQDNNIRNAMAAKGYYNAFQQVKACVARIIQGENTADIIKENLQKWYQNLFSPSVQAGILSAEELFGYRNDRVFIRNSIHSPPPKEAVVDAMEAFFECLKNESHPGVNAVLGHYFFVFIHPYMDGNGRIGRFLMNALLASGGYPWTVIRVENRKKYISTLENTHVRFEMTDFANFIKEEMNAGLNL